MILQIKMWTGLVSFGVSGGESTPHLFQLAVSGSVVFVLRPPGRGSHAGQSSPLPVTRLGLLVGATE